jgi:hypothetical protein
MELTTDEQKILDAANDSGKRNRQSASKFLPFMIVGAIGAGVVIIDGVVELMSGNRKALGTIGFAVVVIAFFGVMYQFFKFRDAALSLVSKLQRESNKP